MLAICSVVIDRPCPMGRLPNVEPDQSARGGTEPELSPGSSTPVLVPTPRLASIWANRSGPRRCAVISVPTLEDLPRTPFIVIGTGPCTQASLIVRSATLML